ncbi:MAG TPA: SGNH/GDSL hydrolase family protein [Armatimonadota bacterium]|jgi:lysophospholipase L1-like esterase
MSSLLLKDGDRFLFQGDSITDAGRRSPEWAPWGLGYPAIARGLLMAQAPGLQVEFFNRGIGGDTTVEMEARWEEDCLELRPTWMSVLIGINDVWRFLELDRKETGPEFFGPRYEALLSRAVETTGCRLLLIEPFLWAAPAAEPVYTWQRPAETEFLAMYRETTRALAEKFDALFVPAQAIGDAIISAQGSGFLCAEPVHPNLTGHAVLAQHLVAALQG